MSRIRCFRLTSSPAAQSLCDGALGVYLSVTLGGALLFGLLLFGAAMLTKDKAGGTPKRRKRSSVFAVKPSKDGFEFIVILAASVALGVATLIGRPVPIYYCNAYGSYAGATASGSLLMVIAVLVVKWRALRPALGAQVAPGITVQGALGIWFTVWWATAAGVVTYIAPIEDQKCSGCNLRVSNDVVSSVLIEQKITQCDQCGRIVYIER
mgnify:CR=1 FL=1